MRDTEPALQIFEHRVSAHNWPHLHERVHRVDVDSAGLVLHDQEAVRVEDGGDWEADEGAGPGGSPGSLGSGRLGDGPRERGDEQEAGRGRLRNGLRGRTLLWRQSVGEEEILTMESGGLEIDIQLFNLKALLSAYPAAY